MKKRDKYQKIQFYGQIISAAFGGGIIGMLGGDIFGVLIGIMLGAIFGAMIAVYDEEMYYF